MMLGHGAHAAAPPAAASPAPADDPAKVAAARAFIMLYHPRTDPANVKRLLDTRLPRMIELKKQRIKGFDARKFEAEMRTRIMNGAAAKLDLQAHVVSRHFSLDQLKALVAFFKGPLGGKLVAETPRIQQDMLQIHRREAAQQSAEEEDEDDDATPPAKPMKPSLKPAPAKPRK